MSEHAVVTTPYTMSKCSFSMRLDSTNDSSSTTAKQSPHKSKPATVNGVRKAHALALGSILKNAHGRFFDGASGQYKELKPVISIIVNDFPEKHQLGEHYHLMKMPWIMEPKERKPLYEVNEGLEVHYLQLRSPAELWGFFLSLESEADRGSFWIWEKLINKPLRPGTR